MKNYALIAAYAAILSASAYFFVTLLFLTVFNETSVHASIAGLIVILPLIAAGWFIRGKISYDPKHTFVPLLEIGAFYFASFVTADLTFDKDHLAYEVESKNACDRALKTRNYKLAGDMACPGLIDMGE